MRLRKKPWTRTEIALMILASILALAMLTPQVVLSADTHWPLPFQQAGDTIWMTHWRNFDSVGGSIVVGTEYRDTTISMDNSSHNMITVKYQEVGETYSVGYIGLYAPTRASVADSIELPLRLWLGEVADSTERFLYFGTDSTHDKTYYGNSEIIDSVPLNDTIAGQVQLLTYYDGEDQPSSFTLLFNPAGTAGGIIYDTVYAPPPVPASEVVRLYYDAGQGVIDSATGAMNIRSDVRLSLEIIGAPTLNNGLWGILPFTEPKKPDSNGRCTWDVPATTTLSPAGARYRLSWKGRGGYFSRGGTIKTFIVDTIIDPLNIIDAIEVW